MTFSLFWEYYQQEIFIQLLQHMKIVLISIPIAILISVPLGFYITGRPKIARYVIGITSVLMTIPSLALFGIMVAVYSLINQGLGVLPAVTAIVIYSLLPITRNTYLALNQVSPNMIDAAIGIGMSAKQILWEIKIPLSVPTIMAGIRNAIVMGVGVTTYAYLIAAGGLGFFIFAGIGRANYIMIVTGAVLISFLGIGLNFLFLKIENWITPRGLKVK